MCSLCCHVFVGAIHCEILKAKNRIFFFFELIDAISKRRVTGAGSRRRRKGRATEVGHEGVPPRWAEGGVPRKWTDLGGTIYTEF